MKNVSKILMIGLCFGLVSLFSCVSLPGYQASEMERQMTDAMLRDDIAQVKELLAQGASPNSLMPTSGAPVLGIAVQNNNIEMAKLLIDAGADVNIKDSYGMSLLHQALKPPMMRLLLQAGADLYSVYNHTTPYEDFAARRVTTETDKKNAIAQIKSFNLPKDMYEAGLKKSENAWLTRQDIIDTVLIYKEFKYDVNRQYEPTGYWGLLTAAAQAENYEFLIEVISRTDANVNIRDKDNASILNYVTAINNVKRSDADYEALLSAMMKKGLLLDAVCAGGMDENATALMCAARYNYTGRVKALIKAGANPNALNENHRAAINFARNYAIVKHLIDKGADPLNKDKWAQTALFGQNDVAVLELLLSKGVKLNAENAVGESVLFSVTDPKVTEYLIQRGIDINHVRADKRSALEADVARIIDALRFDKDIQDLFIPKFKVLMKYGIDKAHAKNAYELIRSGMKQSVLDRTVDCLKSYID